MMFPPDFGKWAFIACLFDNVASERLRAGYLLTKEEFLKSAIVIATTPEGIGEIVEGRHPVTFVHAQMQAKPAGMPLAGLMQGRN